MQSITAEQLSTLLDNRDKVVLLDVRDPWEFEICRLTGSLNIPMNEIAGKMAELDPDSRTIVICHFGMRSMDVANYLESAGFGNIVNLEGGLDAWAEQVDPDMPRY